MWELTFSKNDFENACKTTLKTLPPGTALWTTPDQARRSTRCPPRIRGPLLHINVQRVRGGLVFKTDRRCPREQLSGRQPAKRGITSLFNRGYFFWTTGYFLKLHFCDRCPRQQLSGRCQTQRGARRGARTCRETRGPPEHHGIKIGNLSPSDQRQRRTCDALCHILYPVSAAHTSIFRIDSNTTS